MSRRKQKPSFKLWIEYDGKPVLGKGGSEILKRIEQTKSISETARELDMSYRYVWNYLQKIEKTLEQPVVETFRGGKSGGGGAILTDLGKELLEQYELFEGHFGEVLSDLKFREVTSMKLSARNRLKGKVLAVEKDGVMAKVKVEVKAPAVITALISREAAEDLSLKVGDEVEAIVKATEVIVAK